MLRVTIPQIFENMEEATIGRWTVAEGTPINEGDALCELITEKTTLDLTAEGSGLLRSIVAPEKSVVPPGYIIALIGDAAEELPDAAAENAALLARKGENPAAEAAPALKVQVPTPGAAPAPAAGSRVRATPAARRAAKDAGVDLDEVAAAFPGKVLGESDVKAFVDAAGGA